MERTYFNLYGYNAQSMFLQAGTRRSWRNTRIGKEQAIDLREQLEKAIQNWDDL